MARWIGGIEAGGTKFVCAVGTGPDDIREARVATTTPGDTIRRVVAFFTEQPALTALGIASFGPVDLDPQSRTFGSITTTPKPGWQHVDLVGPLRRALGIPIAFDTDVNGAALAEHRWGCARDVRSVVYVTVGSGIGGGAVVDGQPVHGLVHPEMGHQRLPHDRGRDPFCRRVSASTATAGRAWPRRRRSPHAGGSRRVAARRPSGVGSRGGLPRARPGELGARALARADRARRRRHGAREPLADGAEQARARSWAATWRRRRSAMDWRGIWWRRRSVSGPACSVRWRWR